MTGTAFFEHVADAVAAFLPPSRRGFHVRRTSFNLKLWYGADPREHYEVQLLGAGTLKAANLSLAAPALEIGFHAEHREAPANDGLMGRLAASEKAWRKALGKDVVAGPFLGATSPWRRVSEVWGGPDVVNAGVATEAADRLAVYVQTLQPLLEAT